MSPTWSAWLFYVGNIGIVFGYLLAATLLVIRRGLRPFATRMRFRTWISGLGFFLLCGATHLELALHTYFGHRVLQHDGTISWHMVVIHAVQAVAIWCFLMFSQTDRETVSNPPLEGTAKADGAP